MVFRLFIFTKFFHEILTSGKNLDFKIKQINFFEFTILIFFSLFIQLKNSFN